MRKLVIAIVVVVVLVVGLMLALPHLIDVNRYQRADPGGVTETA